MFILILLILFVGLLLSAFFSGTETGFYRVSRVRLLLDGLGGDVVARALLWLTNNPTLFVATTLIGNNVANYLVSLGIVLATEIVAGGSFTALLIAPVAFAPVVFVYGELLPKNLYFQAPNRLLRVGAPAFFFFAVLFAPLTAILWVFGRLLRRMLGASPEHVRLMLARKELARVLEEGHQAGLLRPAQRDLAQGLFSIANQPAVWFATPPARIVSIRKSATKSDMIRLARRQRLAAIPIESEERPRRLLGYVRIVDLHLEPEETSETVRPFLDVKESQTLIEALMKMQSRREVLARVVDEKGQTRGLLSARRLIESLFRGE